MKKMKSILLLALTMLQLFAYSQVSSKDEIVKRIFELLKNKDEEGFVKLYPDAATIKQLVWQLMAKKLESDSSGKIKKELENSLEQITDSLLAAKIRQEFKGYIGKGEKVGIDWGKTVFVSYTADSIFENADDFAISKLSGKIYFNYNSKEYFLGYGDIIRLEKGWYGGQIERVGEKSRENEPGDDDKIQMGIDSVQIVDSIADSIEPPPPPKPKQPVKKQPVKRNTQSPAKKP